MFKTVVLLWKQNTTTSLKQTTTYDGIGYPDKKNSSQI